MTIRFTVYGSGSYEHELPAKFAVCDECDGHGTHLADGLRGVAFTQEQFNECFDEDAAREYFKKGGSYDVRCKVCAGDRVMRVVDTDAAARTHRGRRLLRLYEHAERMKWEIEEERKAELRWGLGY